MTDSDTNAGHPRAALMASARIFSRYAGFLDHLLTGLADRSVPVVLICPPHAEKAGLETGTVQIPWYRSASPGVWGRFGGKRFIERLAGFEPDVIHCLCESRASLAAVLARRLNVPYVLSVQALQKKLPRLKISAGHCGGVIAPAKTVAVSVERAYPRIAHRLEQINFGAFVSDHCAAFEEPSRLATIVTAHPLDRIEDFERLLAVFRHLRLEGSEFMAIIMGQGRAERPLRRMISSLGLLQNVSIVPPIQPCRRVFAAADIFVRPVPARYFDPFLLEAMGAGTAVAACRGGVDDLVVEDQTAAVFDPKDRLSLMRSIQSLLSRPEPARRIAAGAQEYVRRNHSVDRMISGIMETYRQAIEWYRR